MSRIAARSWAIPVLQTATDSMTRLLGLECPKLDRVSEFENIYGEYAPNRSKTWDVPNRLRLPFIAGPSQSAVAGTFLASP
jgi:hypothetical protein